MLDLPSYDRDAIDGAVLDVAETRDYVDRLVAMTVGGAARHPVDASRPRRRDRRRGADLARVLAGAGVEHYRVSEADILDGIAWSLVDQP